MNHPVWNTDTPRMRAQRTNSKGDPSLLTSPTHPWDPSCASLLRGLAPHSWQDPPAGGWTSVVIKGLDIVLGQWLTPGCQMGNAGAGEDPRKMNYGTPAAPGMQQADGFGFGSAATTQNVIMSSRVVFPGVWQLRIAGQLGKTPGVVRSGKSRLNGNIPWLLRDDKWWIQGERISVEKWNSHLGSWGGKKRGKILLCNHKEF